MPANTLRKSTNRLFDDHHRNRNPLPQKQTNLSVPQTDISSYDAPIEIDLNEDYTPVYGTNLSAPVVKPRRLKAQKPSVKNPAIPHTNDRIVSMSPVKTIRRTRSLPVSGTSPQQREMDRLLRRHSSPAALPADSSLLTEEERLQDPEYRKKITWSRRIGYVFALIIAVIDGINTAVAAAGIAWLMAGGMPVIFLIGFCGFLFNRVVYWRTVPDMLKQIFVLGLFTGLTPLQKILTSLSSIFAVTLGAAFAALAFKSLCVMAGLTLTTIFLANPALGAFFALLAGIYFVANTSLFLKSLAGLIRDNAHKQIIAFFKRLFSPDPNHHPIEQALTTIFQIVFTILGFSLAIVAAYALLGKLSNSLGDVLFSTGTIAKETAIITSKVIVFGIASVARFLFSLDTAVTVFCKIGRLFGSFLYNTGWMLTHWEKAKPLISAAWKAWKDEQSKKLAGTPWDHSWKQWRKEHATIFKKGTLSERLACYSDGFKHAFSELGIVKKFFTAWFLIHIPAIIINAFGQGALGAGGGNHVQDISHSFGINIDADFATHEAMATSGLFSATLGINKYIELNATPATTATPAKSMEKSAKPYGAYLGVGLSKSAPVTPNKTPGKTAKANTSASPYQDYPPTTNALLRRSRGRDLLRRSRSNERQPLLAAAADGGPTSFLRI